MLAVMNGSHIFIPASWQAVHACRYGSGLYFGLRYYYASSI